MSEEQPVADQPAEAPSADAQQTNASPHKPQQPDPRRRLRELLAIPERNRTDANWDELAELEIQTAPGNRVQSPQGNAGQRQEQSRGPGQVTRSDANNRSRPGKRFNNQRKRGGPAKP